MNPMDPALLAGSATGSGSQPDPVRVTKLTQEAEQELARSSRALADIEMSLTNRAADHARAGMEGFADSVGVLAKETVRRGNLAARAARKVVEHFDALAEDQYALARRQVQSVGGDLPVLLEDHLAYQMAGEYELPALEMVLGPVIDYRMAAEMSGDTRELPAPPPTPDDKFRPGDGLDPGVPYDPIPLPPDREPDPDPIPGPEPEPEPEPVPEPPSPTPPTGGGGECCPPTSIIVPAPVVHVHLPPPPSTSGSGGSPPTPPEPPPCPPCTPTGGGDEPTPTPPPTVPPPTKPPGNVPPGGWPIPDVEVDGFGPADGPDLCAKLLGASQAFSGNAGRDKDAWLEQHHQLTHDRLQAIPVIGPILSTLYGGTIGVLRGMNDIGFSVVSATGISNPNQAAYDLSLSAVTGLLDKWVGTDFSYYMQPFKAAAHFANPVQILSQSEVDAAYLADRIDRKQWECLTRANGNLVWQHEKAMLAKEQRTGLLGLIALNRRGQLSDAELYRQARGLGYLDPAQVRQEYRLTEQVPSLSDLMTWMVKDVANEDYAAFAGLDDGFGEAWSPVFQAWADAQGITSAQVKYAYRSQWQDIPPTQIYQMFWRLRPGRVPDRLAFTRQNALDLLKIQEVPAKFRERILEVAYLPINRTDILAAHKAGTMDDAEVEQRFMDLGYSPADANTLMRFTRQKSRRETAAAMGAWTQRRIIKEYIAGNVTFTEADGLLSRTVIDGPLRIKALEDADVIRGAQGKGKCIAAFKKRYLMGEFDEQQVTNRLIALGVDVHVADELVRTWGCEKGSRRKEPTVQMLQGWVYDGIITWAEMDRRLRNLGFTPEDAARIRVKTDIDNRRKRVKEARSEDDYAYKIRERGKKAKKEAEKASQPPKT